MSEHTPGPWAIKGPSRGDATMDDGGDYAIVADGQIVAEAICKTAASTFQPAEANARLIAAAPDLLAAVKDLLHQYRMVRPQIFGTDYHEEGAHAAINKAELSPS